MLRKQELRLPWQANQSFERRVTVEGEIPISKENDQEHESLDVQNRSPWQIGKSMQDRNTAINDQNTNIMFRLRSFSPCSQSKLLTNPPHHDKE